MSNLGYEEKVDALSVRIEAHKKYSNFSLEDWLNKNLPFSDGNIILDIGCGSGNLFPVYSKKLSGNGVIVGLDQSAELLFKASLSEDSTRKVLLEWNMNNKFPFISESFNHIISSFAIYYAEDVKTMLKEIERVLKKGGYFLLIGPTDKNATELYEFNKTVFSFERDDKIAKRTNRLEMEFYPASIDIFQNVKIEKIESKLFFPNKTEFLKYYKATLLFDESVKKAGYEPSNDKLLTTKAPSLEISKEMIVVWGAK